MCILKSILFIGVLVGSVCYGQNSPESLRSAIRGLSIQEKAFYDSSLASCQEYNKRTVHDFSLTGDEKRVLVGTFSDSFQAIKELNDLNWREGIKVFRNTNGIGMQLYELLHSEGFMLAMKQCFPNDFSSEKNYVLNLFIIDATVKGLVAGVVVLSTIRLAHSLRESPWGVQLLRVMAVAQGAYWIYRGGQKLINPKTHDDNFARNLEQIDEFISRTAPKKN